MRPLLTCLISLVLLSSATDAYADVKKCKIDFNYGLVVNKNHIRVVEESRTVAQINYRKQLFIGGNIVDLDTTQRKQLRQYADGLHYVVPKMVVLASEGVDLAIDTVDEVYMGIVGAKHESYEKLNETMMRARNEIRDKFRFASDHYFIAPGSLEQVDDFVDQQIEEQLGEAISTSLGGILTAISGLRSADRITEERMQALSRRLEAMSVQLEQEVENRAETLRDKAQRYCLKIEELNRVEETLRQSVRSFKPFDVIVENH